MYKVLHKNLLIGQSVNYFAMLDIMSEVPNAFNNTKKRCCEEKSKQKSTILT